MMTNKPDKRSLNIQMVLIMTKMRTRSLGVKPSYSTTSKMHPGCTKPTTNHC